MLTYSERLEEWANGVLDHKDSTQGDVTALLQGLYFLDVGYPTEFGLPASQYAIIKLYVVVL